MGTVTNAQDKIMRDFTLKRDSIFAIQGEMAKKYMEFKDSNPEKADEYLALSNSMFTQCTELMISTVKKTVGTPSSEQILSDNLYMIDRDFKPTSEVYYFITENKAHYSDPIRSKVKSMLEALPAYKYVGKQLPQLRAINDKGVTVTVNEYVGEYLWINFWTSW